MKLCELAYIIGDDGSVHHRIVHAIDNLKHHQKTNKDKKIRDLCGEAISRLEYHKQNPKSVYDDPHTFMTTLSHFEGDELDSNRLLSAINTLGSYTPSDND